MFKFLKMYSGLSKGVYILSLVQFINRLGDFVVPFLSLFLITKLGYSSKIASLIVSCAVLMQIPGSMLGGIIADHWSRKRTYLIAQTASAICIFLCGFVNKKEAIIPLLLVSTFSSSSIKPLMNTMVYDILEPKDRKFGYSLLYLGTNFGVSVGPILAGFLFNHHLRLFFVCDAATSIIAVIIVLLNITDIKRKSVTTKQKTISTKDFILHIIKRPELSIFFILFLVYNFIYVQSSFSLPIMLNSTFNSKGVVYFSWLMSINAVTVVLSTAFITYLTKNKASLSNIALAGVFYSLGFGSIGISKIFAFYVLSTIMWTIGEILMATNSGVYVVNLSSENMRARCTALMMIISSVGRSLGVFTMGRFISGYSVSAVWPVIMILALLTSFITCVFSINIKKQNSMASI